MEHSSAFTTNDYISKQINGESINLDIYDQRSPQRNSKMRFSKGGRVSPAPSCDSSVRDPTTKWKRPRRFFNIFQTISSFLSVIAFVLAAAIVMGFIEPRNLGDSKSCRCASSSPQDHAKTDALKDGVHASKLNHVVEVLKIEVAKLREKLESHSEKIFTQDSDIKQVNEKVNDLKNDSNDFTTASYFSEKFGSLQTKMDNNLTQLSIQIRKLTFNFTELNKDRTRSFLRTQNQVTKLRLFYTNVQDNVTMLSANVSKLFADLLKFNNKIERLMLEMEQKSSKKFDQFREELQTNGTKVSQRFDQLSVDVEKCFNATSKQIQESVNISNNMLERFQRKTKRNLTTVSQIIDELIVDVHKLENDTQKKFLETRNRLNKFLDPHKFRGPRGYNGTRGATGQQGPPGPAGPRGPPVHIDFTKCVYTSKKKDGERDDAYKEVTMSDTKNHIVLGVSCDMSFERGKVQLLPPKNIPDGFEHTCACDNAESRPEKFTCTIKYLLCPST